jgi:hypothetical protein
MGLKHRWAPPSGPQLRGLGQPVRLAYVTLCSLSRRFRGRRAAALVLTRPRRTRPRPHGFTVPPGPARALVITGPARLDGQIANGEPLTSG